MSVYFLDNGDLSADKEYSGALVVYKNFSQSRISGVRWEKN